MGDARHFEILYKGADAWNRWRSNSDGSIVPDLSGTDLSSIDLAGVDLSGANLAGSRIVVTKPLLLAGRANLRNADLSGSTLIGANLLGADLRDADLSGTTRIVHASIAGAWCNDGTRWPPDFDPERNGVINVTNDYQRLQRPNQDLRAVDLRGHILAGGALFGAILEGVDLSGQFLVGANLAGADLRRASLQKANASGALLREADLSGAVLRGARLRGANLEKTTLVGADLSGANLEAAQLRSVDLTDADLTNADLTGAVLDGALLRGADLSGARMGTRRFAHVVYDDRTIWPSGFDPNAAGARHVKKLPRRARAEVPSPVARWAGDLPPGALGDLQLSRSERRTLLAPVTYDRYMGDAEIAKAAKDLVNGRWQRADRLFADRPDHSWFLYSALAGPQSDVAAGAFAKWSSESVSVRSLTLLGMSQIRDAWEIRGETRAAQVDPAAWKGFYAGLQVAEQTLQAATQQDPSAAAPYAEMLTSARGLQLPKEEANRRFQMAHSREPFGPRACTIMLQNLCAKWTHGSHGAMFAFARWVDANAPADSPSRVVIFQAHYEFQGNQEDGSFEQTYFANDDVAAEVEIAAAKFLEATSGRAEPMHLGMLNWMLATMLPRDRNSALIVREIMRRLDGRMTRDPWRLGTRSTPSEAFARARKAKLALAQQYL